CPADPSELTAAGELGGHGDGIGRLTAAVQVQDGVVDGLVGRAVEVIAAQGLHHVGNGVLGHQHAADHALFGTAVLRRGALEAVRGLRHIGVAHTAPPCPARASIMIETSTVTEPLPYLPPLADIGGRGSPAHAASDARWAPPHKQTTGWGQSALRCGYPGDRLWITVHSLCFVVWITPLDPHDCNG